MGSPYVGEIRMWGGNFAPQGWEFCNGQELPISGNDTLFALIGTTYGGDGQNTFALPNLQSRIPVHQGTQHLLGQTGGAETVQLTSAQIPMHSHPATASSQPATDTSPLNALPADWSGGQYSTSAPNVTLDASMVSATGNGLAHDNLSPYLAISFIISMYGIFPSQ